MKLFDQPAESDLESSQMHSALLSPLKRQDFDRTGKMGSNVSMAFVALWANRLPSWGS
jgi:hypothetical protein